MDFVSLHNHSVYSLLDGLITPEKLVEAAVKKGMSAVAISDHGSISGAVRLSKAAREYGIKPIIGTEFYLVDNVSSKEDRRYHICLYAKTEKGYDSLLYLMNQGHKFFHYVPRIDLDILLNSEDLIVTTACSFGVLAHPNYERIVSLLKQKLGEDFYLEMMPLDLDDQREVNARAVILSEDLGIKLIVTNDCHYLNKEDEEVHNFLLKMNSKGNFKFSVNDLYFKNGEETLIQFKHCDSIVGSETSLLKKAIENTQEIADKVTFFLEKQPVCLPYVCEYPDRDLQKKAMKYFEIMGEKDGYRERMEYELKIIKEKEYSNYFLVVEDFVRWAREQKMELGAGRGSAGGSLVCYALGITDLDPIKEGLLFERFINPDRIDYPDIDIDFPMSRRNETFKYLAEKWGRDHVSNISTVTELKPKSAFKEVAREFNIPFHMVNEITKMLDNDKSLEENIKGEPILYQKIMALPHSKRLLRFVEGISGVLKNVGTHAAGVVITPNPIFEYGVMEKRKEEFSINWDMKSVEYIGLVKIDVLGLRTLDVIAEAKKLIRKRHGISIQWDGLNLNTSDVLEEFGKGNTVGIFQFESNAMAKLVKQLSPITDKSVLIDCSALVRPGPMESGMTEIYINRHHGRSTQAPSYQDFIRPIVEETHGVTVYQEQVIKILVDVAGYSIAQADSLRRVFAKKLGLSEFEKYRESFIEGCKKTSNMPEEIAISLFEDLEKFSRYGFNRSHAAAYTELGLRQMWLKIHYPLEYMCALYTWTDELEKKAKFREECHRLGILIIPPDINKSERAFSILDDSSLIIGFSSIKQVGDRAIEHILKQRKTRKFKSFEDFRIRVPKAKLNKVSCRNMILTGCFDTLNLSHQSVENEAMIDGEEFPEIPYDYSFEEKELNKLILLPGVYSMGLQPVPTMKIDEESLEIVRAVIGECKDCSLRKYYPTPVAFDYTSDSQIMVVAEAPGEDEVREGRPLVGKAGTLLMDLFEEYDINRSQLYLTNVYKCRPPNNKLPDPCPIDCHMFLQREIQITQPGIIFALGARPFEYFTGQKSGILAKAEEPHIEWEVIDGRPVALVYTVHPASTFYGDGQANKQRLRRAVNFIAEILDNPKGL